MATKDMMRLSTMTSVDDMTSLIPPLCRTTNRRMSDVCKKPFTGALGRADGGNGSIEGGGNGAPRARPDGINSPNLEWPTELGEVSCAERKEFARIRQVEVIWRVCYLSARRPSQAAWPVGAESPAGAGSGNAASMSLSVGG